MSEACALGVQRLRAGATDNPLLEAALRYAELGFAVFPCKPGGKAPATGHGFKDASTDPATIRRWWTQQPDANIGLPTAGLVVIDVDGADNPWPGDVADGFDSCPLSITPRGGQHYVFRQPPDKAWRNSASKLAPAVDTRAEGGYIVVAPSTVNATPYRWVRPIQPAADLPEPPAGLVDQLDHLDRKPSAPVATKAGAIPNGERNATLASLGGTMRRRGMGQAEILAALRQTNLDRCTPPLEDLEVAQIAGSVARYPANITVTSEARFTDNGNARRRIKVIDGQAFLEREFPDAAYVVKPYIPAAGLTIVGALPKVGKSYTTVDLALAVVSGGTFLGQPVTEPGNVLLIDAETTPQMLQDRIKQLAASRPMEPDVMKRLQIVDRTRIDLDSADDHREILGLIAEYKPKLVILDPLRKFHRRGENDPEMSTIMGHLDEWKIAGPAIVVVHHMNKSDVAGRRLGASLSGHNTIWSSYDAAIFMARDRTEITVDFECRYVADQPRLRMRLEIDNQQYPPSARFVHLDRDTTMTALEQAVLDALQNTDLMTMSDLKQATSRNGADVKKAVASLVFDGVVGVKKLARGEGYYARPEM